MTFVKASDITFTREQIAVGLTYGTFGSHIGLAFHSAKDGVKLLHLQFHLDIDVADFPPVRKCWIATTPDIHKTNAKFLVGVARAIAKRKPPIPFGINLFAANGSFDSNGHYVAPKGSDGLTCATFVSEIFRSVGLALIADDTWQERPGDFAWGEGVCSLLKSNNASDDHIAAVRANINGIRLRPEEVAFSADRPRASRPVKFAEASAGGKEVMATLEKVCPQQPQRQSVNQTSIPYGVA